MLNTSVAPTPRFSPNFGQRTQHEQTWGRYLTRALVALTLAGCATGPSDTPSTGRYELDVVGQPSPWGGNWRASGTMVLTFATADSLAGRFEMPHYRPNLAGARIGEGIVLFALSDAYPGDGQPFTYPEDQGVVFLLLRPIAGGFECIEAHFIRDWAGHVIPATCTIQREGR